MGALRRLFLVLLLLLLVAGALGAAALWLALESAPAVPRPSQATLLDLARAMRLAHVIDPRQQGSEGPRELSLSQRDLELLIDQGAQRTAVPVIGRVTLLDKQARLQASLDLTELMTRNPAVQSSTSPWFGLFQTLLQGRWLNVDLGLREAAGLPDIASLRLGRLPLPGWVGEWLLRSQVEQHLGPEQQRMAREMIKTVRFAPDRLQLGYLWRPGSLKRMMAVLVPKPDQDRLRLYLERLAGLKIKSVAGGRIPMGQLLQPALALAQQRTAAGRDAALENRSAILALAFASFPRELVTVLPAARHWRLPRSWRLVLAGREDFPLHYLISAALAAEAGGPFADAVGVFKEVLDARGRSGFSFNDLAADRAGTRFGLLARQRPATLQTRAAAGLGDADFLPDVRDLPESLTAAEFTERYGAIGSPSYQRLLADIEARIDTLALYR